MILQRSSLIMFAAGLCVLLSGCSSKQYVLPEIPEQSQVRKIFNTPVARVTQGVCDEDDITMSLNGAPANMQAAAVKIENKTDKPLIVEIERTNMATYTCEDLALMFSKIGIEHPDKKKLVINHDCLRTAIVTLTVLWSAIFSFVAYKSLVITSPLSQMANNIIRGSLAGLMTLPFIALGWYAHSIVMADRENILESEEEHLIEHLQQIFEPAVLSFDDCVEIAPHTTLDQIIFYDVAQKTAEGDTQRELVLRLNSDKQKTLIPLEL